MEFWSACAHSHSHTSRHQIISLILKHWDHVSISRKKWNSDRGRQLVPSCSRGVQAWVDVVTEWSINCKSEEFPPAHCQAGWISEKYHLGVWLGYQWSDVDMTRLGALVGLPEKYLWCISCWREAWYDSHRGEVQPRPVVTGSAGINSDYGHKHQTLSSQYWC